MEEPTHLINPSSTEARLVRFTGTGHVRCRPADAVTAAGSLPIVLTRVGRERPEIAATVEEFVTAARAQGARLEIIDVPNGQHSFDVLDDTDESRKAIERAFDAVLTTLG